ncbi:MAG: hypothetical protein EXR72_01930 [Myxococcales bacterium]|nr:hypothetical protein [Myxococcales bacterium]
MRVLAIDGGPSPLLLIRLLRHMEEKRPGTLAATEMFAGTSDGAFTALYLAARLAEGKMKPLEIIDGCIAFSNGLCKVLHATSGRTVRLLLGGGPLNLSRDLRSFLQQPEIYGTLTLGDLDRLATIVTFDAFHWRPHLFRNFVPEGHSEVTLVDAALASSAFPMLLPLHSGNNDNFYLDGGVVANNPAMGALASGLQYMKVTDPPLPGEAESDRLRHMTLFSMGGRESLAERKSVTGKIRDGLLGTLKTLDPWRAVSASGDLNWGWMQWILLRPLFLADLLLQGSIEQVTFQCHQLLGRRFYRYSPPMAELKQVAKAFYGDPAELYRNLDQHAAWLCGQPEMRETLEWIETTWLAPTLPLERAVAIE